MKQGYHYSRKTFELIGANNRLYSPFLEKGSCEPIEIIHLLSKTVVSLDHNIATFSNNSKMQQLQQCFKKAL